MNSIMFGNNVLKKALIKNIMLAVILIVFAAGCTTSSPPSNQIPIPSPDQNGNHSTNPNLPPQKPQVGFLAPSFSLPDLKNETVTLNQFRGKPVILIFWVLDCDACMEELMLIQSFYEKQSSADIHLLTISVGEPFNVINDFILENKFTFPVLLDENADVCIKYERGAPTIFFLDKDGIILQIRDEVFHSIKDMESTVANLYGK